VCGWGGVGVERRDRLGERLRVVHPRDPAAAVVAAVRDDGLRAVVERAERIGERQWGEAVIQQIVAIAANLETSVRRLQVFQVRVMERVAGDLVAGDEEGS
jgi:GAF domain-containing protein